MLNEVAKHVAIFMSLSKLTLFLTTYTCTGHLTLRDQADGVFQRIFLGNWIYTLKTVTHFEHIANKQYLNVDLDVRFPTKGVVYSLSLKCSLLLREKNSFTPVFDKGPLISFTKRGSLSHYINFLKEKTF